MQIPFDLRARRVSAVLGSAAVLATAGATPAPLAGQSVLDRPPNIQGTWTGRSGTVYFNFVHRFTTVGGDADKVVNYPTFLLGAGLPADLFVGARYGSNSELVPAVPNEWELFARWGALSESDGAPVDVTFHGGYNDAAESADGEVLIARSFADRLRVMAGARVFSDGLGEGDARGAWMAGGTLRISEHVALAGDVARLFDLDDDEGEPAWSAGLQLAVPYTPHTLSLQASNATTTTLQGASIGVSETRWGFEFTIPFTLSRYFGEGDEGRASTGTPAGDVAIEVGMTNRLTFTPDTVEIQVGQTVRWRNTSDVLHTVTADPSRAQDPSNVALPDGASTFDSGDLRPGETFEHTFSTPGEYRYFCVPHELAGMTALIIVRGG